MTEKYIIQPSGDQILMVEKETNTALYVKEVVKKLNEHAKMIEALKLVYDDLTEKANRNGLTAPESQYNVLIELLLRK